VIETPRRPSPWPIPQAPRPHRARRSLRSPRRRRPAPAAGASRWSSAAWSSWSSPASVSSRASTTWARATTGSSPGRWAASGTVSRTGCRGICPPKRGSAWTRPSPPPRPPPAPSKATLPPRSGSSG